MKRPFLFIGFAAILLSIGCKNESPTAPATNFLEGSATYATSGNKLILFRPAEETRHCDGAELIVQTEPADTDTIVYELSGNTLKLFVDSSTLESGAAVVEQMILGRSGSGSSLEGTWRFQDINYVITGTATAEEQDSIANEARAESLALAHSNFEVKVQGSSIFYYVSPNLSALLLQEVEIDTSVLDITLSGSGSSLVLTGNRSHEVVTISLNSQGDLVFTSSNAQHAPHTYYRNPTTCPNHESPEWLQLFFFANMKFQIKAYRTPNFHFSFPPYPEFLPGDPIFLP